MLPPKLARLREEMEEARAATLAQVRGRSDEELASRAEGEWSAGQILHHLLLAETGASKVIRKVLRENEGRLPPYPADDSGLSVRADLSGVRNAPEVSRPVDTPGKEGLLRLAEETRAATLVSLEMLAGADPSALRFPHPNLGLLDLYEWASVVFLRHERSHRDQLEAALARRTERTP